MKKKKLSTRTIVVAGMLSAISAVLGMTPIGIIPLPIANLTTMHIPAILGGILEGPIVGMLVGLIFGLSSLYKAVTAPTSVLSPFLVNPLVSVLPRMLIGPAAWLIWKLIEKAFQKRSDIKAGALSFGRSLASGAGAFVGTLTNTAGVLGMMWLLYADEYAGAMNVEVSAVGKLILGITLSNGLLEAAAAVVIVVALERALRPIIDRSKKRAAAEHDKALGEDAKIDI